MEDLKIKLKVAGGHAASISQQIQELNTFLSEISAIATYSERGITDLKIQPIILEIVNRLNTINGSVKVILEETSLQEDTSNESEE